MYSAYLFLAFIFGRTLLVESTAWTITEVPKLDTDTVIGFKVGGGTGKTGDTAVHVLTKGKDVSAGTPPGDAVTVDVAQSYDRTADLSATGLIAGTEYDFRVYDDSKTNANEKYTPVKMTTATLPLVPVVKLTSADSTSAKFNVDNYGLAVYESVSATVDGGTPETFTSKDIVIDLTGQKSSQKLSIDVSATKFDKSNKLQTPIQFCTAPKAPTYTTKLEPDEQASSKYTLTVTIEFGADEKVSTMNIALGIDVPGTPPTSCDKTVCTDCTDCTITPSGQDLTLDNPADTKGGLKFSVILKDYPEADLKSEFKITAKYDEGSACGANVGTIEAVKSLVNKINRDVIVVYLAIGTMATVLRLLGLEVWTPLSSH